MCDRQLQYSRPLAALEMRHENDVSVWQFERVMMSVGIVLIYLAKSSNSEVGGPFPNPALIVF
jgi:adenylosuccinate lyase